MEVHTTASGFWSISVCSLDTTEQGVGGYPKSVQSSKVALVAMSALHWSSYKELGKFQNILDRNYLHWGHSRTAYWH